MYIVVGLGNPGEQYARTRHNTGRMAADYLGGKVEGIKVFTPDTFMNKTGPAVAKVVKSKKAAQKLVVIYDDLDLALGTMKISYNRSSGGHKGVESIIRVLKTKEFIRIRIGIGNPPRLASARRLASIQSRSGREAGKDDVEKHILGNFSKPEIEKLKKVFKRVSEAVEVIVEGGLERAMNQFN